MASVRAYREAMASFAQMRTMDIWYAHLNEDELKASIRSTVAGTAGDEKGAKKDQNEWDYQQFVTAIRSGRLEALEGV
jgi:hypothetical protein